MLTDNPCRGVIPSKENAVEKEYYTLKEVEQLFEIVERWTFKISGFLQSCNIQCIPQGWASWFGMGRYLMENRCNKRQKNFQLQCQTRYIHRHYKNKTISACAENFTLHHGDSQRTKRTKRWTGQGDTSPWWQVGGNRQTFCEIEQSAYESADALRWLKEFCEKNEHLIIIVTKSIMALL